MSLTVKQCLDTLFKGVVFDTALYKKLVHNNIGFITRTQEHKHLFGSRLIGCFHFSYTKYDKNLFYDALFGMDVEEVISAISHITTIPKHFKVARDDVNLVTFYLAHRFLTNDKLSNDKQLEYAKEALNYFNYRTLVLKSSEFFVYPISEEKAVSLSERLSNKYIIKRVKNWNEYCQYRSSEFLDRKFTTTLTKMDNDKDLASGISDLYNRTKDALINIYGEFVDMLENDDIIKSRKNVATDAEGKEVVLDRTESPALIITKVEQNLVDKNNFIRKDFLDITTDIVNSVSYKQLEETLSAVFEYNSTDGAAGKEVTLFIHDFLVNCFEYLQQNEIHIGKGSNVLKVINSIAGNVLYARGTDVSITKVKDQGEKLIKKVYKQQKLYISDRNLKNVRNAFCIYLLLLALL